MVALIILLHRSIEIELYKKNLLLKKQLVKVTNTHSELIGLHILESSCNIFIFIHNNYNLHKYFSEGDTSCIFLKHKQDKILFFTLIIDLLMSH